MEVESYYLSTIRSTTIMQAAPQGARVRTQALEMEQAWRVAS